VVAVKYDVILADPPWKFNYYSDNKKNIRHITNKYPIMETSDICNLPIGDLAAKNSVLFIWAVWPNLFESEKVINAWGFTFKTLAWVWVKAKPSGFGFFTGMGFYTRANTEPCLLAVKGSMPVAAHDIQALIYDPVREHSRKPDDQYRKIEALYPDRQYLELFARRPRKGWQVWGNEVISDIQIGEVLS